MKETSLQANKIAPRVTHKSRILEVLKNPMTNKEISDATYNEPYGKFLKDNEVAKRTCELEADLILFDCGVRNGETIYFTVHSNGLETAKRTKADKHKRKYIKRLNGLLKEFGDISTPNFDEAIENELSQNVFYKA